MQYRFKCSTCKKQYVFRSKGFLLSAETNPLCPSCNLNKSVKIMCWSCGKLGQFKSGLFRIPYCQICNTAGGIKEEGKNFKKNERQTPKRLHQDTIDLLNRRKKIEKSKADQNKREAKNKLSGNKKEIEDFSRKELDGIQKEGAKFNNYLFKNTSIRKSNFNFTTLINCNFESADIRETKLFGTKCKEVNFSKANCYKASFKHCKLEDVDFRFTNLKSVSFEGGSFKGVDFRHANLERANMENCNFQGVLFYKTNLRKVNFSNANLETVDLKSADLEGAIFNRKTN